MSFRKWSPAHVLAVGLSTKWLPSLSHQLLACLDEAFAAAGPVGSSPYWLAVTEGWSLSHELLPCLDEALECSEPGAALIPVTGGQADLQAGAAGRQAGGGRRGRVGSQLVTTGASGAATRKERAEGRQGGAKSSLENQMAAQGCEAVLQGWRRGVGQGWEAVQCWGTATHGRRCLPAGVWLSQSLRRPAPGRAAAAWRRHPG